MLHIKTKPGVNADLVAWTQNHQAGKLTKMRQNLQMFLTHFVTELIYFGNELRSHSAAHYITSELLKSSGRQDPVSPNRLNCLNFEIENLRKSGYESNKRSKSRDQGLFRFRGIN